MLRGLIFAFGLLSTGLAVIFADQDLATWFDQGQYEEMRLKARAITNIALGEYWLGVGLIVFLLARFVFKKKNLERWGLYLFCGIFGSGILLHIIKRVVGRERPHLTPNHDQMIFAPFNGDWHFQSFPSGHAQVLFASAVSLSILWPKYRWAIYLVAASLAFTRVMILQHFLSDVIGGAMLGYFGALWVHSLLAQKVPRPEPL